MSLNVTETALDVTGFCKIYYNQQEKDKGPWSKAIGPFLMQKKREPVSNLQRKLLKTATAFWP
jgi:hypothetical protein